MRHIWFVCLLIALCGCGGASVGTEANIPSQSNRLIITGSSTVAPLMSEIAARFESEHPEVRIDIQTGGSSRGMADVRQRLADIGMVSRALKSSEQDLKSHLIARDGLCLIVHGSNPVGELSKAEIIDIYTGKITHWHEVGGSDNEIVVVHKAEGRSTLELFLSHFQIENLDVEPDVVIGDNQQGIKTVLGNPDAIGYVSIGAAEYEVSAGRSLKLLPLGGIPATTACVRDGTFPLSRELNLVTTGLPTGIVQELIEFAQASEVNDLIEGLYFVPVKK